MELVPVMTDNWSITADLFGGNIVADWANLDNFSAAIEDLGVTTLRYPGGSQTEHYFDIDNPDAPIAVHNVTGEVKSYIPLSDFMAYADENNHPVTVVIPTKTQLSDQTDELGHRYPDIDEEALRTFVRDVASGEYGSAKINAFEIGNEYWHSGNMDSVEYGRLASEMSSMINNELELLEAEDPSFSSIEVLLQMGHNYGTSSMDEDYGDMSSEDAIRSINEDYGLNIGSEALFSGGSVNWTYVNNVVIMQFFEAPEDIDAIDGIVTHVYTLGEEHDWSRSSNLVNLNNTWLEKNPDLSIHVTEWNQKGITSALDGDEDYGLHQAEEMLNILEEFTLRGVDHAQVWPLIQNTDNTLNADHTYGETNVPGAMFSMLSANLPGKQLLDFAPRSERVTEATLDGITVHGFAGPDELLLYVIAEDREGVSNTDLDLSDLVIDFESMELTILGVQDGALSGSNDSVAELETVDPASAYVDGFLDVPLDAGEILQVRIKGIEPTDVLRPYVTLNNDELDPLDGEVAEETCGFNGFGFPTVPVDEENVQDADDCDGDGDIEEDAMLGLEMVLAIAPVLGLLMMMG